MKKIIAVFVVMVSCFTATHAQSDVRAKLSPFTKQYLHKYELQNDKYERIPNYVYKKINNRLYLSALIKVSGGVDQSRLDALGVFIGTRAGNIWTAQIPVENMVAFTAIAGISYINLDMPIFPVMDSARKQTKADSAQKGYNLPMPVAGKNVIVGIIDAGFDFNHPAFYDTTNKRYRIKKVWSQKVAGTPPIGFAYGNEMTDTNIIKASGYDTAITSHGSHVAGIAAGSGNGGKPSNSRYRGMAYESDIVLVGIMPDPQEWIVAGESDIVDGMNYIFTYAALAHMPAVVNLSWGSTLGSHDGSSLFGQACDALTGPGKIFVCAAGNNGQDTVHLKKTFTLTDTTVSTFVTFSPYLDTNHLRTWVDVWGDTGNNFCLNVKLYNGPTAVASTGFVCLSDSTYDFSLIGSNGDTCYVSIATVLVDHNGRPHAFVELYSSKVDDNICLTTWATAGNVNMWEGYVLPPVGYYGYLKKLGYPWAVSGDANMTVSDIGSTKTAITAAAYTSKTSFTNISGAGLVYPGAVRGKIAPFSSFGPTSDLRVKPDIAAPGFGVTSAVSSFDSAFYPGGSSYNSTICADTNHVSGRVYKYAIFAGTSMASPCVAGIVAMMLQVNPSLDPTAVKDIISLTAIKDANTGVLPTTGNNTWGHGKINAYGAVRYMAQLVSVKNVNMDPMDCILYPNPNRGVFSIDYTGKVQEELTIDISDAAGRAISSQSWMVNSGANNRQFDIQSFSKGLYFVKVSSPNGYNVMRVVKE